MTLIKNISFFLILATGLTLFANLLDSNFLFIYLKDNIIGLLLTLLAINTATSGLIASKIQDIVVSYPKINFSGTIKEMKLSLLEQIILIGISVIILIVQNSTVLEFENKYTICNILLTAILIYAINVLWDTGKAVFIIIEELQKLRGDNE